MWLGEPVKTITVIRNIYGKYKYSLFKYFTVENGIIIEG